MNDKLVEKMAWAMSAKDRACHSQMFWRDRAREALTAVHKHLSQREIEEWIEDAVMVNILTEEVDGVRDAARAVRNLLKPTRESKIRRANAKR